MNRIENMLLDLKNTSELMIDLAYSSLLFNSNEIAEEVVFLEEKMDELSAEIQEAIVNYGKESTEDLAKLMIILRLQMAIEDIANAAASIADVVLRGLGDQPVIQMSIQESEVVIDRAIVTSDSQLNGKTLGEVKLSSNCGMFIIAIKRGKQYIFGPGKDTRIQEGDVLIAKGPEDGVEWFKDFADGKEKL